jgi:hypothetical protein
LIGDGEKRRPLIIISSTADVQSKDSVICVCCSHSTATFPILPAKCVLVPPKIGKRETKLNKPTAAVCYWIVEIKKDVIEREDLAGSTGEHILGAVLNLSKESVETYISSKHAVTGKG